MKITTMFITLTTTLVFSQGAFATYADDLLLTSEERLERENNSSTRTQWEDARSDNDYLDIQREEEYIEETPSYEPIDVPVENQDYEY